MRNKADKECEINAKLEGQRDDLIEQINQTNHKNEKILASIKDLEYGIGAKEEKIIAAKDEEMNARIKKQEITSKIESEIRMLNDEVTQMDFQTDAFLSTTEFTDRIGPRFSKFFSILVRAGPGFLKLFRSRSDPRTKPLGPGPTGFESNRGSFIFKF